MKNIILITQLTELQIEAVFWCYSSLSLLLFFLTFPATWIPHATIVWILAIFLLKASLVFNLWVIALQPHGVTDSCSWAAGWHLIFPLVSSYSIDKCIHSLKPFIFKLLVWCTEALKYWCAFQIYSFYPEFFWFWIFHFGWF